MIKPVYHQLSSQYTDVVFLQVRVCVYRSPVAWLGAD